MKRIKTLVVTEYAIKCTICGGEHAISPTPVELTDLLPQLKAFKKLHKLCSNTSAGD